MLFTCKSHSCISVNKTTIINLFHVVLNIYILAIVYFNFEVQTYIMLHLFDMEVAYQWSLLVFPVEIFPKILFLFLYQICLYQYDQMHVYIYMQSMQKPNKYWKFKAFEIALYNTLVDLFLRLHGWLLEYGTNNLCNCVCHLNK